MSQLPDPETRFNSFLRAVFRVSHKRLRCENILLLPCPMSEVVQELGIQFRPCDLDWHQSLELSPPGAFLFEQHEILIDPRHSAIEFNYISCHELAHFLLGTIEMRSPDEFTSKYEGWHYYNLKEYPARRLGFCLAAPPFLFKLLSSHVGTIFVANYFGLHSLNVLEFTLHLCDRDSLIAVFVKGCMWPRAMLLKLPHLDILPNYDELYSWLHARTTKLSRHVPFITLGKGNQVLQGHLSRQKAKATLSRAFGRRLLADIREFLAKASNYAVSIIQGKGSYWIVTQITRMDQPHMNAKLAFNTRFRSKDVAIVFRTDILGSQIRRYRSRNTGLSPCWKELNHSASLSNGCGASEWLNEIRNFMGLPRIKYKVQAAIVNPENCKEALPMTAA